MIRPYESRDFEDVLFLNGKTSYLRPCTDSELREKLTGKTWVYESDPAISSVVGSIITCPDGLLWSITVARNFQNQGIGTQLIREARKHFSSMYLYVFTESPAKKLYEREGFKVEKFLFNHYGRNEHAYLMRMA